MLPTTARFAPDQASPKHRRRLLIVLLAGVLIAAATGSLSLRLNMSPTPGWASPTQLLATSGANSADSGGATASGPGGTTGGDATAGAVGDGGLGGADGSAGKSTGGRAGTAALSRVAAGLVDVDTITDNAQLLGTGMVLRSDGLVLTNHHVIDHATQVRVRDIGDDHVYRATVAAVNTTHDLALLRLQGAANLTVVPFGDSRAVKVGDPITALGNAGGGNSNPIASNGTVTALNQDVDARGDDGTTEHLTGMIQGNAPATPGDSGGPMINATGQIIGVTTAGSDDSASNGRQETASASEAAPPAVVDATPINVARDWIAQVASS